MPRFFKSLCFYATLSSVYIDRMSEIKQYIPIALTIFTVLGAISTYWFYTSSVMKVANNPETLPEVTEDIVDKEIVEPIERLTNLIVLIANIIKALPAPLLVIIILSILYFTNK